MLLRWRCCYVEDVVALKMLLRWRCCCVEDVVTLTLLRWRCCYVEDVVALKMLLQMLSKRICGCEENKKPNVHFAHGSLVDYDIFISIKRNLKFQTTRNSHGIYQKNINGRTYKTKTCKHRTTYPRYVVRMSNWFLVFSSYGKNTKHCKTEWIMTFFKVENNELELLSGEPQASTLYIYIYNILTSMKYVQYIVIWCNLALMGPGSSNSSRFVEEFFKRKLMEILGPRRAVTQRPLRPLETAFWRQKRIKTL